MLLREPLLTRIYPCDQHCRRLDTQTLDQFCALASGGEVFVFMGNVVPDLGVVSRLASIGIKMEETSNVLFLVV